MDKLREMIALIDYGMGNLRSVAKALENQGGKILLTSKTKDIERADKIVLPGVGAFGKAVRNLRSLGLIEPLKKALQSGKPFLGICLGLQILFEKSEEGGTSGLGILPGEVKKFPLLSGMKIPHMGWNTVKFQKENHYSSAWFKGISDGSYFYFVHSYFVVPAHKEIIASTTFYGIEFVSSIAWKNIFACQFHPEKSGEMGLKLISNFLNI